MKSRDIPGHGSPLMGSSTVTSSVSGTWVSHNLDLIFWAAWGYTGCCRCRHRGDLWDSWCGGNSCGLWLWRCRCCGCNKCGLHWLCRFGWCRLWHRDMGSGRSLQCGCCSICNSISRFDTAFTQVSPCAAVISTIAHVYLVAFLW